MPINNIYVDLNGYKNSLKPIKVIKKKTKKTLLNILLKRENKVRFLCYVIELDNLIHLIQFCVYLFNPNTNK